MDKEKLKKANEIDYAIDGITIILNSKSLYIADGSLKREFYTTNDISDKLREILTEELARLEKELAEL